MHDWIIPDWPAPSNVKSLFTTRTGGVSHGANGVYNSLNLGMHVKDNLVDVTHNRALLRHHLPAVPRWLKQVHGTVPISIDHLTETTPEGDAVYSRKRNTVCAVMVADCLPVLLCNTAGTAVGIVHAGWRGLSGGIIEKSIEAMQMDHGELMAWLGPAIGPNHFEVGTDVYEAFVQHDAQAKQAFVTRNGQQGKKWLTDIFLLARQRLVNSGIVRIYGGGVCTYSDPLRFYSYRRDGETGRMAALIWFE
ncbi:peptidoglycan editing factor PgeF [Nitrosomonas supralitoralis]|uniref:Purine nucleoside phosphorylase n=1 Tax=Nitrosomonas supralitoralis TaxID=2116706 RepID=A0A2P7NSX7_9PROT|nr:peptidoglycan editing factor PgeF [Nitrosomonas supralitoralis]PSJ16566.1 peptidoglycan editing factor PgeF [Nitrosomonas supralitoralis]